METQTYLPRLSYLAFLLPKLHAFFYADLIYPEVSWADAWLEFENVPLKWHYPLGLLYDLYSGADPVFSHDTSAKSQEHDIEPWKLTVHFSKYPEDHLVKLDPDEKHLRDLFTNNVKEVRCLCPLHLFLTNRKPQADFLRNGTGKTVMFLSKEDSDNLWEGVKRHDLDLFNPVNKKLLNPQGVSLRNIPVRLYLPHTADEKPLLKSTTDDRKVQTGEDVTPGSIRVVQGMVPLASSSRESSRTSYEEIGVMI